VIRELDPIMRALGWLKWMLISGIALGSIVVGVAIWVHDVDAKTSNLNRSIGAITTNVDQISNSVKSSEQSLQTWKSHQEEISTRLTTITEQIRTMVGDHEKFIIAHGWPDPNHPH